MSCVKTGCHVRINAYGLWGAGDAHQYGQLYVFRLIRTDYDPFDEVIHYTILNFEDWFDRSVMERNKGCSTLIVRSLDLVDHGYDGQSIYEGMKNDDG